eukprot:TRINITY_DN14779_c0_g5_i1.p3 TRINITY_DN14779_c0_g5~~TRINITY_DN14779_c0_g5_i1.p3  ORF type:complete len:120 (-),score=15.90 TRINITY_DN14779_c0_g5_i1:565-924(-)
MGLETQLQKLQTELSQGKLQQDEYRRKVGLLMRSEEEEKEQLAEAAQSSLTGSAGMAIQLTYTESWIVKTGKLLRSQRGRCVLYVVFAILLVLFLCAILLNQSENTMVAIDQNAGYQKP